MLRWRPRYRITRTMCGRVIQSSGPLRYSIRRRSGRVCHSVHGLSHGIAGHKITTADSRNAEPARSRRAPWNSAKVTLRSSTCGCVYRKGLLTLAASRVLAEPGRCRVLRRPSTRATVDGEAHRLGSERALPSNSPPCHKPAGHFNRMWRGSELGRQVAVDFESDADLHECRSCPIHSLLPPSHISQQHNISLGTLPRAESQKGLNRFKLFRDGPNLSRFD